MWEVLCIPGTISCEYPWEVMPDLCFSRDPQEIENEEQAVAGKAMTNEGFQGERVLHLLSSLLLSVKLQTGLKVCRCPLCLFSSSLPKTGALSLPVKVVCSSHF